MKNLLIIWLTLGIWLSTCLDGESFEDIVWRNVSNEIVQVNCVWVDRQNPQTILIGTDRGVFKTKDGGSSWQAVLFGINKKVKFLYTDRLDKNLIYACCSNGLFFSQNQGRTWQRIYQEQEVNCLGILQGVAKTLYLGTQAGLLRSQDGGITWDRLSGRLRNLSILAITEDNINKFIYLVADDGVYRIDHKGRAGRIFVSQSVNLQDADKEEENSDSSEDLPQINHLCVDSNKPQVIYLATNQGVFITNNQGRSWRRFAHFGLLNKRIDFISTSQDSLPLAITKSGIFIYNKERWQELTLRLAMQDIRFLTIDDFGNIYAAGDKGLFKSSQLPKRAIFLSLKTNQEPTIQEIQRAAIEYAQVIDPKQIALHRRLARLKAILPDFSLDYDKTISTYSNSQVTRFSAGPRDWGASLKWSLGDLIWSEQQRLIDSQVRLMVKLRQDILDEVTRLYFERKNLQLELASSQESGFIKKQDKELRIEELTALLDGLTGGYLSKYGLTE